jgi:hypothetical protein
VPLVDFLIKGAFAKKKNVKWTCGALLVSFVITTLVSSNYVVCYSLRYHPKVFISKDVYDALMRIRDFKQKNNTTNIIFIYDLKEPGIVELYDNWVSAVMGDHLSYYGSFCDFIQLKERYHNLISIRFFNNLIKKSPFDIFNSSLIFFGRFYSDISIVQYLDAEELCTDVYVCNLSKLLAKPSITMPIKNLNFSSLGHWYVNQELNVLEIYSNETQEPYVLLHLNLPQGCYNFTISYWDGSKGNGLKILVNDILIGTINYTASADYQYFLIENINTNGVTAIKIVVFKQHIYNYFARLKSITIAPNPFNCKLFS